MNVILVPVPVKGVKRFYQYFQRNNIIYIDESQCDFYGYLHGIYHNEIAVLPLVSVERLFFVKHSPERMGLLHRADFLVKYIIIKTLEPICQ